jgi:3-oxoacyl-[acyl-carrier-protein] synthase III
MSDVAVEIMQKHQITAENLAWLVPHRRICALLKQWHDEWSSIPPGDDHIREYGNTQPQQFLFACTITKTT